MTRRLTLWGVCVLLLALPVWTQSQANQRDKEPAVITGTLIDERGKRLKDVLVELLPGKHPQAKTVATTRTDGKGNFSLRAPHEEWCRLVFTHEREHGWLNASSDFDDVPLRTAEGGRIDLGTLTLRWSGVHLSVRTTFGGKAVPGVAIHLPPRVNRPEPILTDHEGKATFALPLRKGDRIVLLADDGREFSGWYAATVEEAGKQLEVEIPLVRGRASLRCSIADAVGRPLQRKAWVYLAPAAAEMTDDKVFAGQSFRYVPSYFAVETDELGRCQFNHLAPGKWHVSALLDGARLYPDGMAGKVVHLTSGDNEAVWLQAPFQRDKKDAAGAKVEGRVDYRVAGRTMSQWTAERRAQGITRPLRLGVYFIPKTTSGEFLLQPVVPNVVIDLDRSNHFTIESLPAGEYLVFAGGIRQWVDPTQLPDRWMLSRGTAPTYAVGKVTLEAGKTVHLDMTGVLDAKEIARRYQEPLHAVERFLAHLARQRDNDKSVDK
ncbi:MAG: carboxypeptidase-like regulatory domain-containing protein [Abditibacteriales bacterium]|nr:carboxypeptidase-like regulatory domain-containing protein [Abditibacteriales bacterium]MDW8367098.1 carboxypeptidase-like regulatory domain-containing protein [Abditibacteriales bacterium]